MERRVIREDRKNKKLKPKKIILIASEGKTEKEYFNGFNGVNKNYRILFAKGNNTDSNNLICSLINSIKKNKLNEFEDFNAFCVFDIDTYGFKENINLKAIKECISNKIVPITSTPCIELWFLLHFEEVSHYIDSKQTIEKLKNHITDYKKGKDIYNELINNIDKAIIRAKRLEQKQLSNGHTIGSINANPNTEVFKLIEYLNYMEKTN